MAYTSFFRDPDALDAIRDIVAPAHSHRRAIRVWDAGCATGEEPYTLAILFATCLRPFPFRNLDILATDYEESSFSQFGDQIRSARYGRKDVFWVPEDLRERFLLPTEDPEVFEVVQELRDRVRYVQHDLLTLVPPEGEFCLVVCKNVIMHFTPEAQVKVLEMFHGTLVEGGYLAMDGNQELPAAVAHRFQRCEPGFPLFRKV